MKVYKTVEEAILAPLDVKVLVLEGKRNEKFPIEIFRCKNLVELKMNGYNVNPHLLSIFELTQLRELELRVCGITHLPQEIKQLTKLTSLNLSINHLSSFPIEVLSCDKLEILDLDFNKITYVPKEISQLKCLAKLSLWDCGLLSIPKEISTLKFLKYLNLKGNPISIIPPHYDLTYLSLRKTKIGKEQVAEYKKKNPSCRIEANQSKAIRIIKKVFFGLLIIVFLPFVLVKILIDLVKK